jgi:hypothetical protein
MTAPEVLTTSSTLTCAHQGTIQAVSSTRLRVNNAAVLLAPVKGKTVSGCILPDDPQTSTLRCKSVALVTTGESSKLRGGKTSVLLATLAGFSDGTPPQNAKLPPASANQTRLRAAVAAS